VSLKDGNSAYSIKIIRENKDKNRYFIFGIFILARTPPSHEYYLLPIIPVFAILAAKGVERFSLRYSRFSALKKLTEMQIDTFFTFILIISIIPFSYAVLSYSGELGYTATRDAGEYINSYMDSHPQETFYILKGNFKVTIDGVEKIFNKGDMVNLPRGTKHEISANTDGVIEEISSTHYREDSYYIDSSIMLNKNRKTVLTLWGDEL